VISQALNSVLAITAANASPRHWADALTGVRDLSWAGDGVELELARSLPAYGWAMLIAAIVALALWTYLRITGPLAARLGLAALRSLTLLLLALLACGPRLVKQNERVERDWVVLMADRSQSMGIADVEQAGVRLTREEQLQNTLRAANRPLGELAQRRNVLALGFDAGIFDIGTRNADGAGEVGADAELAINLGEPAGARTALGASLAQALQRVAARPVAGVVLMSDGRSFDATSRDLVNQLVERQIPVFAVPLGSADGVADLAITRVDAPQSAFVGDLLPIRVDVEALGAAPGALVRGRLQLLDEQGRVIVERDLQQATIESSGGLRSTMMVRPEDLAATGDNLPQEGAATQRDWTVRLIADGADLTSENNSQSVRVELVNRPIRVLYVDGYPRWEYRYVKNLLLREKSIRSTTMLLAAERRFIQEGTERIEFLPRNTGEWAAFDVVMLGDMRPGLFSDEQLAGLREAVSQRGVGLLWIGGPSFTPGSWRGTVLGDLLPFSQASSSASSGIESFVNPVLMEPGPAAGAYGLLQLGEADAPGGASDLNWPMALSDPSLGWPKLHWSQRVPLEALKPAAEVLALAREVTSESVSAETSPLIVTMRYGAGRSVYVGTDETWRYRYGRGETLTERLWIPAVRLLARGSLGRTGKPALLEASPDRALVNQPVRVLVRLLDQSLLDSKPATVRVQVARGMDASLAEQVTLEPEGEIDSASGVATYSALWVPGSPGTYAVTPTEPVLAGLGLSARVLAQAPEDELRRPQTDHPALEQLALATGGRVLSPAEMGKLAELLPNREVRTLGTPEIETIWDKPWALIALLLLVGIEWIGRRLIKLS
jgi:hypothetical protein